MKCVLAANTMEHPGFVSFVQAAARAYPGAAFIVCGDLLNVFPEPGEDIAGSIFSAIYGPAFGDELDRLRLNYFRDVHKSPLIPQLREIFLPQGATYTQAMALASHRYTHIFAALSQASGNNELYYIPGNMDYPELSALFSAAYPNVFQLDGEIVDVGGVRLAGVGGIPSSAQPFGRVTPISPYEMTEEAYERRLAACWGADILVSHLSPAESPALDSFLRESPVRALICRAPFSLQEAGSCRGMSQCDYIEGKLVVRVRPFDYPENFAFVVDFPPDPMVEPTLEIYDWRLADEPAAATLHDLPHGVAQSSAEGALAGLHDASPAV